MSGSAEVHHQWDKPPGSVNLTLEAWSQGFVIGALIIMTGITTANMKHGSILHKLILLEVGPKNRDDVQILIFFRLACHSVAGLLLHILRTTCVWLVSFFLVYAYDSVVAVAQRCCLDQMQAFPAPRNQPSLHRYSGLGSRLLDP